MGDALSMAGSPSSKTVNPPDLLMGRNNSARIERSATAQLYTIEELLKKIRRVEKLTVRMTQDEDALQSVKLRKGSTRVIRGHHLL